MADDFNIFLNQEAGSPSSIDYYSSGSEETVKSQIRIPPGMSASAHSARVNEHQNDDATQPVGVPGTTYTPSRYDQVYRSEGGHAMIMGNAAGSETFALISKGGAAVEMDSDGAFKVTSKTGMHMSIGSDGQIILSGALHIVAGGELRFKSGSVHFDCADFNINASGNMKTNIHGSKNESVIGDKHSTVQGDASNITGGDSRNTVAGSYKRQVAGDMTHTTKSKAQYNSKGDMTIDSKGNINKTSEKKITVKSNEDMSHESKAKMTQTSEGDYKQNSKGAMAIESQGAMSQNSKGAMSQGSGGNMTIASKGVAKMTAQSNLKLGSPGKIDVQTPNLAGQQDDDGSNSVSGNGDAPHTDPTDPTEPTVEKAKVENDVPEEKQILDHVGDYIATEGEIDKIYTSNQLDALYDVESGGEIPEKVKKRAQEKGIIGQDYTAGKAEKDSTQMVAAVTEYNQGYEA